MNRKNLNWIIWVGGIGLLSCWGYGMSKRISPDGNQQDTHATRSSPVAASTGNIRLSDDGNWSPPSVYVEWNQVWDFRVKSGTAGKIWVRDAEHPEHAPEPIGMDGHTDLKHHVYRPQLKAENMDANNPIVIEYSIHW